MNPAMCVLAYSLAVTVIGPPLLARATRAGTSPGWGIAAWLAAMISVLGSWVVAVGLLGAELARAWGHLDRVLGGCVAMLAAVAGGGRGPVVQAGLAAAVALTALGVAALAARVGLALHRARRHTRRHADAAVLAARGGPRGPGGALIVDAPQRSVYCLPGPSPIIVITRAALAVLDLRQLEAVLAHERAHLTGRHHQLLAFTGALARILPGLRLFADGAGEVARLAEMCADDAAARCHGPHTVVDALLALCAVSPAGVHTVSGPLPLPALGATEVGLADRVERLLFPPTPARARAAAVVTAGTLLLGPPALAALMFTQSPLCPPSLF